MIDRVGKDLEEIDQIIINREISTKFDCIECMNALEEWIGQIGLSDSRLRHSREVARVATYIAKSTNCLELSQVSYLAGLVHDCGFSVGDSDSNKSGFRLLSELGFRDLATIALLNSNSRLLHKNDKTFEEEYNKIKGDFKELLIVNHFVTIANQIVDMNGNYTGPTAILRDSLVETKDINLIEVIKYNTFYALMAFDKLFIRSVFTS